MPLTEAPPVEPLIDTAKKDTFQLTSRVDGCQVEVSVYSPSPAPATRLPLLLGPHAITWTSAEDYHGGLIGLKRGYHRGYLGLPDKHKLIIAMPHGHDHREDLCSLAGPGQISDMVSLVDVLEEHGYLIDRHRIYACGLSMGGLEALVLAGRYPDQVAGVVAFNPIVDLAAWYDELANSEVSEIREYNTAQRIANEVGGTPETAPEAYAERSVLSYAEGLSRVPTLIFWSDQDLIVPGQIDKHTMPLYRKVKAIEVSSPIAEYNHTRMHGPLNDDKLTRWQLHEWCDYDLAVTWLLRHEK